MRLTSIALEAINEKKLQGPIMTELNISPSSVYRIIKENKSNGPLVTAGVLEILRKETRMSDDELLERESITA